MSGQFTAATDDQISELLEDPEGITDFLFGDDERRELYIDKSWHAIHFLLNGEAWSGSPPLDFICAGGNGVGDVDVGYGPARAFSSAEVRAIEAALRPITRADLLKRWDAERIRKLEIYAVNTDDPEGEVEYAGSYLDQLKEFLADLARDQLGMVFSLG